MIYKVRPAETEDLLRVEEIYAYARRFMADNGNPNQWGSTHPPKAQLIEDIKRGELYVITENGHIHGVFFFRVGVDPTYLAIYHGEWSSKATYGTIHRIAGDGSGGILSTALDFAKSKISYVRIDTHEDNKAMQGALRKLGFRRCGIIYLEDGSPRIAYDIQ